MSKCCCNDVKIEADRKDVILQERIIHLVTYFTSSNM